MNKFRHYRLDGHRVVGVDTSTTEKLLEWAAWYETADRRVALDVLPLARVSTVFIGLDFAFHPDDGPDIFETMIFVHPALKDSELDGYCDRCSTWAQALEMHAKAMALVLPAHQEAAG